MGRPEKTKPILIGGGSGSGDAPWAVTNNYSSLTTVIQGRLDNMGVYDGINAAYGRCTYGNWKAIYGTDKYGDSIYW